MSELKLQVKGIDELRAKFVALGKDFEKTAGAALVAAGFVTSNRAKELAPVKSGNLRRSIFPADPGNPVNTAEPVKDEVPPSPRQTVASMTKEFSQEQRATLYVGTNVVYAATQEFLPYEHAIGESPYLRPALEQTRDEVKATFQEAFAKAVQGVK